MKKEEIVVMQPALDSYSKYYTHSFYCPNCGTSNHRYVLKGKQVRYLTIECSKCGCEVMG